MLPMEDKDRWLGIAKRINQAGHQVFLVGGAVRDMLMGRETHDFDLCTSAKYENLIKLFPDVSIDEVGKSFKVIIIDGVEVASFRKDVYFGGGDKDCKITYAKNITEDLGRRDFTINSMALNPFTFELIDPYDGRGCIKAGVVRFTGDARRRVFEDPNRVIRGCRFAATLGFDFVDSRCCAELPIEIVPERACIEIRKALKANKASTFFHYLWSCGLLPRLFPSLQECRGFTGGPHHDESVYEHCMATGDYLPTDDFELKLAGYLHDIGKPASYSRSEQSFIDHEHVSSKFVASNLTQLKFSNGEIARVVSLVKLHMRQLNMQTSPKAVRKLLVDLNSSGIDFDYWFKLKIADRFGNKKKFPYMEYQIDNIKNYVHDIIDKANFKEFSVKDLEVNGNDVMSILSVGPSKIVGDVLNRLFDEVVDDPTKNNREYLLNRVKDVKNELCL